MKVKRAKMLEAREALHQACCCLGSIGHVFSEEDRRKMALEWISLAADAIGLWDVRHKGGWDAEERFTSAYLERVAKVAAEKEEAK